MLRCAIFSVVLCSLIALHCQFSVGQTIAEQKEMEQSAKDIQKMIQFQNEGKYPQAIQLSERILQVHKRIMGKEHPGYAQSLNNIGVLHESMGFYERAEPLLLEAKTIRGKVLGKEHPDYATSLNNLAMLYQYMGSYERAEPLHMEAKTIREKVLGKEHPDYAISLSNLATLYMHKGSYESAEPLLVEAKTIREKVLGKEHPDYAQSLNNLASLYEIMGSYERAEPLHMEAITIREKVLGKEHPDYAQSLNNLASLYGSMGSYERAEPLLLEAKTIREKVLGKEHPDYATSLNNLASLYKIMGAYERARPLLIEAKTIREKVLGKEHPDYATSLNNLATLYMHKGSYERAEPHLQEVKTIRENVLGKEHPDYATSLNNLATLYQDMGSYERAEPLHMEAITIREKVLGKEHPDYAQSLNNLASLYEIMGSYKRAEPLLLEAKTIRGKVLGKEHPDYATSLNNLAMLYQYMGSYERAEPLHMEAKTIREKVLGKEHPDYATSLNNLATLYQDMGSYERAEPLHIEAITIRKKVLGKEHPDYATSLNNLATLYEIMGSYERAEPLHIEAITILEKVLGKEHPNYAACLSNLATLHLIMDKTSSAISLIEQCRRSANAHVTRILPTLTVKRQAKFLSEKYAPTFESDMAIAYRLSGQAGTVSRSAEWLLNGKAISQTALAKKNLMLRDSKDPNLAPVVSELVQTRRQLAEMTMAAPIPNQANDRNRKIQQLRANIIKLEQKIAAATGQEMLSEQWVELPVIRQKIQQDSVLVEFLRFNDYDYRTNEKEPARYAAWVILASGKGSAQVIDLGLAETIDEAVSQVTQQTGDAMGLQAMLRNAGETAALAKIDKDLRILADLVWKPIKEQLPEKIEQLILSPDGQLWLVPWAALPVDSKDPRVLLEDYSIRLVVSGRDLVKNYSTNKKVKRPFIFADPDYDLSPVATENAIKAMFPKKELDAYTRGVTSRSALGKVGRLPNTKIEAEAVTPNLTKITGQEPQTYSGKWAMETVLKEVKNPKVLMLSTHGFFLPDQKAKLSSKNELTGLSNTRSAALLSVDGEPIENPMLRCGLLFAGCNTGSTAGGDDGIFTGMEVVSLDLRGTEMVVLSACETGIGDVNNGEGVAGLRQAFQLAGAQSVVATLWSVPDRDSAIIMNDFFKNLADGQSRSEALRQAQISRIKSRRNRHGAAHPFFWAAFTLTGQDYELTMEERKTLKQLEQFDINLFEEDKKNTGDSPAAIFGGFDANSSLHQLRSENRRRIKENSSLRNLGPEDQQLEAPTKRNNQHNFDRW